MNLPLQQAAAPLANHPQTSYIIRKRPNNSLAMF